MAETFGSILRRIMKEKKVTHAELARFVGVHRTTITDYVNDKYLPDEDKFRKIHQVFPDSDLYDAFFAATSPNKRKNKPLISNKSYNYYTAKYESTFNTNKCTDHSDSEDNKYIMNALHFVVNYMRDNPLFIQLAPQEYEKYKALEEKYKNNLFQGKN